MVTEIERIFQSEEMFKALILVPIAEGTGLTDEARTLLRSPVLQDFLRSKWARERLDDSWDDTARLGLWVTWLVRLLLERHIASGHYTDEALSGLLLAYGLYAERLLTHRIVADRPTLREVADRFQNRQWTLSALAAANLDWPVSLSMPVDALTRDKSSLSRYVKEARQLIFYEACQAFGIFKTESGNHPSQHQCNCWQLQTKAQNEP